MIRKSYLYLALAGVSAATGAHANSMAASVDQAQPSDTMQGSYSTMTDHPDLDQAVTDQSNQPSSPDTDATRPSAHPPHHRPRPRPRPNPSPKPNPSPELPPKPSPERPPMPERPAPEKPDKPTSTSPVTLSSSREVAEALRNGFAINVDVDLAKCAAPNLSEKGSPMRFGSRIDQYSISSDGRLRFSKLNYAISTQGLDVVTRTLSEYVVDSDGTVNIQMDSFNSLGYRKGKPIKHTCRIGKGVVFKAE